MAHFRPHSRCSFIIPCPFLLLHSSMLPPRNNPSHLNVDASSSRLGHKAVLHKQVAPSSQDQHNQSRIDRWLPSVGTVPGASQTSSSASSNLTAPAPISRSPYSTSHTASTGAHPNDLIHHEFGPHARSDSLSFRQHSFPFQQCRDSLSRYYSEPVIRTAAAQAESSHSSFSSSTEAQNRRRRRRISQRGFTPVLPFSDSGTFSVDGGPSTVDTSCAYCLAEPQQGVTAASAVPTRNLPPMTAGYQNASLDHPTFSGPFSGIIADVRPTRTIGFVAIPSSTALEDSVYEIWATKTSESREHVQRMSDGWKEDAKGVLIFIGIFTTIVASFIIESYKMLSPDVGDQISLRPSPPPAASIIAVNIMWLISLVLNIISALFATLALQWIRRYAQLPQVQRAPRGHHAVAMTIVLLHLSVFLFLVGLVIFLFTVHKIVATAVLIVIGLFGEVYLMLTILTCIDHSCPYRTPLSDVWWSRRERLGHT